MVTKHNCFDTNTDNIFDTTVTTPNSEPPLTQVFKVQCESRYHQAEQLYFNTLKAELEEFLTSFAKSIDLRGLSGCASCDPRIGFLCNEKINNNKLLNDQVCFNSPTNNNNGHYQVTRRFKPDFEKFPTCYDTPEKSQITINKRMSIKPNSALELDNCAAADYLNQNSEWVTPK